jgi:hypothetical protein
MNSAQLWSCTTTLLMVVGILLEQWQARNTGVLVHA